MPTAYGEGISWRVEYNEQGQIARSIDPAGRATQYTYTPSSDGSLRAVTEAPPEGAPVTWQFDADGKVEAMKDGEGEVAYHYDNRGQLNAVDRKGSAPIKYSYDDAGRQVELNIGNFYRITWTYDFLGRIANIQTPAGIISYNYQTGQNTVVRLLPNGVRTIWKRQLNGELEEITHGFSKQLNAKQYSVLAQYQYSHGPDGRIAAINEYSGGQGKFTRQYAYDTMGRLVRATGPGGREYGYEYDQAGNRIKATTTGGSAQLSSYDWAGRLTSVDGKPVQYDACGNLISATLDGVARKYAYRPDGRLAKAESGNESAEYRYDGNGQLVVRKSTSGETRFIPDPLSGIGHPLVLDEGGVRTLVIWEDDTPLALVRNGKVEWLLHDHLGSVRMVTDAQGKVSRTCDYDPFGEPVNADRSASVTPGFAGMFRDDFAGGYLTTARAYAPTLGSFLQPDPQKRFPINVAEDYSLYAYCGSDPANYVDFDGAERVAIPSNSKMESIVKSLIELELPKNSYTKCSMWQAAVYTRLSQDTNITADWEVIPYGEIVLEKNLSAIEKLKLNFTKSSQLVPKFQWNPNLLTNNGWSEKIKTIIFEPLVDINADNWQYVRLNPNLLTNNGWSEKIKTIIFEPLLNIDADQYEHYFVVIRSKADGKMWIIDPWQGHKAGYNYGNGEVDPNRWTKSG